jgi:hypothetical protein
MVIAMGEIGVENATPLKTEKFESVLPPIVQPLDPSAT